MNELCLFVVKLKVSFGCCTYKKIIYREISLSGSTLDGIFGVNFAFIKIRNNIDDISNKMKGTTLLYWVVVYGVGERW